MVISNQVEQGKILSGIFIQLQRKDNDLYDVQYLRHLGRTIKQQSKPCRCRPFPAGGKGRAKALHITDINTSRADVSQAFFGIVEVNTFQLDVDVCYAAVARCSLSGRSLLATHINCDMMAEILKNNFN